MTCFANNTTQVLSRLLDTQDEVANSVVLKVAYPNPYNPVTNIQYGIPEPSFIMVSVYDINGRLIKVLDEGNKINFYGLNLVFN